MQDWIFKVGNSINRIATHDSSDGGTWNDGTILTEYGMVDCMAQGSSNFTPHSRFDFVHKGKCYSRSYDRRFTKRGLSMIAKRFAKEISETR
jgi:hypothetical protein